MKTTLARTWGLACLLAVILLSLSGCGGGASDQNSTPSPPAATPSPQAPLPNALTPTPNALTPTPSSLTELRKLSQSTPNFIEELNSITVVQAHPPLVIVSKRSNVAVKGWAVDTLAQTVAGGVFLSVDGKEDFSTIYGVKRPDITNLFHNPTYTNSGFRGSFPTDTLAAGNHFLTIKIVSRDLKSYYVSDKKIAFEIK